MEYENEKAVAAPLHLAGPHQQMLSAAPDSMDDESVRGYNEIARILLDQGVDPNQLTSQGGTYLRDAALKAQGRMVSLLLDHGANIAAQKPLWRYRAA